MPITERMLRRHGILDDETDARFKEIARKAVDDATDEVEALPFPRVADMYRGVLEADTGSNTHA